MDVERVSQGHNLQHPQCKNCGHKNKDGRKWLGLLNLGRAPPITNRTWISLRWVINQSSQPVFPGNLKLEHLCVVFMFGVAWLLTPYLICIYFLLWKLLLFALFVPVKQGFDICFIITVSLVSFSVKWVFSLPLEGVFSCIQCL